MAKQNKILLAAATGFYESPEPKQPFTIEAWQCQQAENITRDEREASYPECAGAKLGTPKRSQARLTPKLTSQPGLAVLMMSGILHLSSFLDINLEFSYFS